MVKVEAQGSDVSMIIDARLGAALNRMFEAVGVKYGLLFLKGRRATDPDITSFYGGQEPARVFMAVARRLQGQPLMVPSETEARATVGSNLDVDARALPLIAVPVAGNTHLQGALVATIPKLAEGELPRRLLLLQCMAEWAGIYLENTALRSEILYKEGQVRELLRATLNAEEAERERICLEVHDGVTQTLASAFQYLQTLENSLGDSSRARSLLFRASGLLRQAIQESREVINSLQPATLKDLGLVSTLRQEMRQLEADLKWKVDFKADAVRLPKDVETGLYRIIQEAITNVKKHAGTDSVTVRLADMGDYIVVEVRDRGRGFELRAGESALPRKGIGLTSMHKRAELLGGHCVIESRLGQGTTVQVEIPATARSQGDRK